MLPLFVTSIPGFPYIPGFHLGIQLWFLINMLWGYMNQPRDVDGSALFTWAALISNEWAFMSGPDDHIFPMQMGRTTRWGLVSTNQFNEWCKVSDAYPRSNHDVRWLSWFWICDRGLVSIKKASGLLVWGTKEFGARNCWSSKWIYHISWLSTNCIIDGGHSQKLT